MTSHTHASADSTLSDVLAKFLQECDWDALRSMLLDHPILLTPEIDSRLRQKVSDLEKRDAPMLARLIDEHRQLLERSRETGVERAFADPLPGPADGPHGSVLFTMEMVWRFVTAATWAESRDIANRFPGILGDDVDRLLAEYIAIATEDDANNPAIAVVEEHRQLLVHCRKVGVNQAFSSGTGGGVTEITAALVEFLEAHTLADSVQLLERHPQLLDESTQELLRERVASAERSPVETVAVPFLQEQRRVLESRRYAVDGAGLDQTGWVIGVEPRPSTLDDLQDRLFGFLAADDWAARLRLLSADPELMTRTAEELLGRLISLAAEQGQPAVTGLKMCRDLLADARHRGADVAFAAVVSDQGGGARGVPPEVRALLSRLPPPDARDSTQHIEVLRQALRQIDRERDSLLWAAINGMMAGALTQAKERDETAEIEEPISYLEAALEVLTQERSPAGWTTTKRNLGLYYTRRTVGDRSDNRQRAVDCFEAALSVRPPRARPEDWASVQFQLGGLYTEQPFGNCPGDLTKAASCYLAALTQLDRTDNPQEWASTQHNLGTTYARLSRLRVAARPELLDGAIACFESSLAAPAHDVDPETPAFTHHELGTAYLERVTGDRADNVDKAIDYYQAALSTLRRDCTPADWAISMIGLAGAHRNAVHGDRADHLEQALKCIDDALAVYSPELDRVAWAKATHSRGLTLSERVNGDRTENLEHALSCLITAGDVFRAEGMKLEEATALQNLGNAYSQFPLQAAENLEKAIEVFRLALRLRDRALVPLDWAATHASLGGAYVDRIRGERAENLEEAISHAHHALEVYDPRMTPYEWAATQQTLGVAHAGRVLHDHGENIERAIACFRGAERVTTPESAPASYASLLVNLSNAFSERDRGTPATNQSKAIGALESALQHLDPAGYPYLCAVAQSNLGSTYVARAYRNTDREADLQAGIAYLERALALHDQLGAPFDCAKTRTNLGVAHLGYLGTGAAAHRKRAISYLRSALDVLSPENMPRVCQLAAGRLGDAYAEQGNWSEAVQAYDQAVASAEVRYQSSLLVDAKRAELEETADLYVRAAYAAARTGDPKAAVVLIERGRARWLGEAQARDRADLSRVADREPSAAQAYQHAAERVRNLVAQSSPLENMSTELAHGHRGLFEDVVRREMRAAQTELNQAIENARAVDDRFLLRSPADDVAAAVQPGSPVAYLATTPSGSLVLLVHRPPGEHASTPPAFTDVIGDSGARHPGGGYLDAGRPSGGNGQSDLTSAELHRVLVRRDNGQLTGGYLAAQVENSTLLPTALADLLPLLGQRLVGPLAGCLADLGAEAVVLIACGRLGSLPLHAASFAEVGGKDTCLTKEFDVSYAPSGLALRNSRQLLADRGWPSPALLAGVGNPTPTDRPLLLARAELAELVHLFPSGQAHVYYDADATKHQLLAASAEATFIHLACHGSFDPTDTGSSGLALAQGDWLSLDEILTMRPFNKTRLVVASACQTAISDFTKVPDEVVGLPAAFLHAGAPGVIGTLWSVNDVSTALLLVRFYEFLLREPTTGVDAGSPTPARALRLAQRWLAEATTRELDAYLDRHSVLADALKDDGSKGLRNGTRSTASQRSDDSGQGHLAGTERPFAAPQHWAAFVLVGA